MKNKTLALFGATIVAGVVFGLTVGPQVITLGGSSADWPDYTAAERLIKDSDRIVIAQYLDETPHVIPVISTADGEQRGSVTEIYQRFKVIESLRGDASEGETTYVVITAGNTKEMSDGKVVSESHEVVPLSSGLDYVLFLRKFPRRPEYPAQYGDFVWTITGEPGIAQVDTEGTLSFKASDRYKEESGTSGSASAASFTLTKEQIEEFASTIQAPSP